MPNSHVVVSVMSHQQLIAALAKELKPFKPVWPSGRVALLWTIGGLGLTALVMSLLAPFRSGWVTQLVDSPRFGVEVAVFGLVIISLSFLIFSLGIPGEKTRNLTWVSLSTAIIATILFAYSFVDPSTTVSMSGKREDCFWEGLFFGTLLMGSIIAFMRNRASFSPGIIGMLSGAVAGTVTTLLMHIGCMYEPYHILTHHVSVIGILGFVGYGIGTFTLRKP